MNNKIVQEKNKMVEVDGNICKIFDFKKRLGKGAYGVVWKATDKRSNATVAIKKIFDAFRDETDAQRTFREIMFLKAFRKHPNVVSLLNIYKATNNLDIYLVFEFMESDLHNLIKKVHVLKDVHKRYVMYQLLSAVKYLHSGNVIHRDLKPSNILIDAKCKCKVADFGLARSLSFKPNRSDDESMGSELSVQPLLTDYVATRWYRAPEILIASKRYTKGIDMWSLGCILGEMIRCKPLFQGSSTVNQIEKIINALPTVTERDLKSLNSGFGTTLLNKKQPADRKVPLDELLNAGPKDAIDMVKKLLVYDPLGRLDAMQALNHGYVNRFRSKTDEFVLNVDIVPPIRDDVRLTVPEYRSKLYEIVQNPTDKSNDKHYGLNGTRFYTDKQKEYKVRHKYIEPTRKAQRCNTMSHLYSRDNEISKPKKTDCKEPTNEAQSTVNAYIKPQAQQDPLKRNPNKKPKNTYFTNKNITTTATNNVSPTKQAGVSKYQSEYLPKTVFDDKIKRIKMKSKPLTKTTYMSMEEKKKKFLAQQSMDTTLPKNNVLANKRDIKQEELQQKLATKDKDVLEKKFALQKAQSDSSSIQEQIANTCKEEKHQPYYKAKIQEAQSLHKKNMPMAALHKCGTSNDLLRRNEILHSSDKFSSNCVADNRHTLPEMVKKKEKVHHQHSSPDFKNVKPKSPTQNSISDVSTDSPKCLQKRLDRIASQLIDYKRDVHDYGLEQIKKFNQRLTKSSCHAYNYSLERSTKYTATNTGQTDEFVNQKPKAKSIPQSPRNAKSPQHETKQQKSYLKKKVMNLLQCTVHRRHACKDRHCNDESQHNATKTNSLDKQHISSFKSDPNGR